MRNFLRASFVALALAGAFVGAPLAGGMAHAHEHSRLDSIQAP
jgi:hypothetical protein